MVPTYNYVNTLSISSGSGGSYDSPELPKCWRIVISRDSCERAQHGQKVAFKKVSAELGSVVMSYSRMRASRSEA